MFAVGDKVKVVKVVDAGEGIDFGIYTAKVGMIDEVSEVLVGQDATHPYCVLGEWWCEEELERI